MTTIAQMPLRELFFAEGIDPQRGDPEFLDERYALPTISWITGPFSKYLFKACVKEFGSGYQPEESDCDDYAALAVQCAKRSHRRTVGRPKDVSLAFGLFSYLQSEDSAHMLNFAVVAYPSLRLVFYEPQRQQIVNLTRREREKWLRLTI